MANRIFTNGEEGKILTSVGNRIIKQPYEFGNGFGNNTSVAINGGIVFDYTFNTSFTLSLWFGRSALGLEHRPIYIYFSDGNYVAIQWRPDSINASWNVFYNTIVAIGSPVTLMTGVSDYNLVVLFYNSIDGTISIWNPVTKYVLGYYNIGAGKIVNRIVLGGTFASPSLARYVRYDNLALFSRLLSIGELNYYYSNKLGNEFQSLNGCEILCPLSNAEIINISGTDQASVRDESGNNRNGYMVNLPAGTPQEKVDYANANLFVPFFT